MCDLLGLSANAPDRASISLPSFARQYSMKAPDGWGIGYYTDGVAHVRKAPRKASKDTLFTDATLEARSPCIVAHLRYGSRGGRCTENCHPFSARRFNRDWLFAHNGTISIEEYHPMATGQTDSETAFLRLLDSAQLYLAEGTRHGLYPAIKDAVRSLLQSTDSITLNFLLSDGTLLMAFSHYPGKPMYSLRREKDYGGALLISTRKLNEEDWERLPEDRLLVACRGDWVVVSSPVI